MVIKSENDLMNELFDRLYPICRSITGPGLRKSLAIIGEYVPLEYFAVKTGTKLFDWTIPPEWHIKEAWLKGPDGKKIVDFEEHNLHVVNYSSDVDIVLTLENLKNHLHTIPQLPEAIPYVTSYYKRRWGFCLPHSKYEKLKPGEYHAYIDSKFVNGELNFGHAVLPGKSSQEVLISSYICHPSMANNELSGPVVAAFLYRCLAQWENRHFTYRFVFVPSTIGSLAYLSMFGCQLKANLFSGIVLTCLGGRNKLSYKLSRRENAPIDEIVKHLIKTNIIQGDLRPFTPVGSDERQYCSPGFNLPVGQLSRMLYASYPEYHSSFDTKELMTIAALEQSVRDLELILKGLELDGYYINRYPFGEIKLDKYNLYPDMNKPDKSPYTNKESSQTLQLERILMVLNYSDGFHTLKEIAERCNCSIFDFSEIIKVLCKKNLLVETFPRKITAGVNP